MPMAFVVSHHISVSSRVGSPPVPLSAPVATPSVASMDSQLARASALEGTQQPPLVAEPGAQPPVAPSATDSPALQTPTSPSAAGCSPGEAGSLSVVGCSPAEE